MSFRCHGLFISLPNTLSCQLELWLAGNFPDLEPFLDPWGKPFEGGSLVRMDFDYDFVDGEMVCLGVESVDPIEYYDPIDIGEQWVQKWRKQLMDLLLQCLPEWVESGGEWPMSISFPGDSPSNIRAAG